MDPNYAQKLLQKTKRDFEKIALQFSQTRAYPRSEMRYFVEKYAKQDMKILDIGCGNGHIFELLKNKKINYLGIDGSKTLILQARKNYPQTEFKIADALNLKFPKNNFDLIFSFAFLHHIPSEKLRKTILKNIYNFLKPKGYFVCTCWNSFAGRKMKYIEKFNALNLSGKSKLDFNDALVPWKNSKGEILSEIYYHRFTKEEIKNLFKESRFKITELFYEKKGKKAKIEEADNLCILGSK